MCWPDMIQIVPSLVLRFQFMVTFKLIKELKEATDLASEHLQTKCEGASTNARVLSSMWYVGNGSEKPFVLLHVRTNCFGLKVDVDV